MAAKRRNKVTFAGALAAALVTLVGAWWTSHDGSSGLNAHAQATASKTPAASATTTTATPSAPDGKANGISSEEFLVLSCNDGDTCRLRGTSNATIRVRLVGVDAPEVAKKRKSAEGQPMGLEAKDFLNENVKGKKVRVRFYGTDAWDRNLGEIFLGEENANLKLVRNGMAEVYRGKPPAGLDLEPYLKAEAAAKDEKKGIWSVAGYQSPKEFRKKNR